MVGLQSVHLHPPESLCLGGEDTLPGTMQLAEGKQRMLVVEIAENG